MAESFHLTWPSPPSALSLGAREVHVWTARLNLPPERAAAYEATLSPDERTRAARFFFERDSRRFAAGRGMLRAILGHYLGQMPAQIRFDYSERGKPSLSSSGKSEQLHFNLAHSDELAVVAVSKISGIGVDVEKLRPIKDFAEIAERFFSGRENKALKSAPEHERELCFFNLWTRKEAWLKATGDGIGELLNQVEVSFNPGEPARLLRLFNSATGAKKWSLQELHPAPGYVGALAVRATDFQVHCWRWPEEKILTQSAAALTTLPFLRLTSHEHRL